MSYILRNLKFTWGYFVQGHRHIPKDRQVVPEWHESPLVGRYARMRDGTWWTEMELKTMGYGVTLHAPGQEPTAAQMEGFQTLADRLPAMTAA